MTSSGSCSRGVRAEDTLRKTGLEQPKSRKGDHQLPLVLARSRPIK
jgi:hypothetical protein